MANSNAVPGLRITKNSSILHLPLFISIRCDLVIVQKSYLRQPNSSELSEQSVVPSHLWLNGMQRPVPQRKDPTSQPEPTQKMTRYCDDLF